MSAPASAAPELPPGAFDDRSATVIGVVAFCLLVSTVVVGLRIWTRQRILKQMGWDDYACALGLAMTYGSAISIGHMTKYGLGKHIYVMDPVTIPLYLRDFYFSVVFYCAALFAIKMTFLFQYYRVLAVQHIRIIYIVAIVIVGGWALSQVFVGIFMCTPIAAFWDSTIPGSKCIPNFPQFYINAAGNIVTDIAVFALPLPAIWKLNLRKQQKYLLLGIFSLGFFTVVISMIRIKYLKLFEDFPWENVDSSLWSTGELTSALTCACLPTLRPLVSRVFPRLGTTAGRSGTSGIHPSSRRADVESSTHHKWSKGRGLSSVKGTREGSEVELESDGDESPFEMHVRRGRRNGGDEASVASEVSELALAPKQPGF